MTTTNENNLLSAIGTRTVLNFLCKILFRFLHFFLNALVLRQIDVNIIGIANVRLQLLYTTILFLSREAFRRTVPKLNDIKSIHHYINLVWLIIPTSFIIILISLTFTLFIQTNNAENYSYYYTGCIFYALAAFIELLSEPFYLLATITHNYNINIYVEMFASTIGFTIQALLIYNNRESALYYFGLGYIIYSSLITLCYNVYFLICRNDKRQRLFIIKSYKDLMITFTSPFVDHKLLNETKTFLTQGIWMKILTEGERYIMSLFNLVSYKDQGIFDTINNLGSLLPRLVFSILEESAYTYFQQTLSRTKTDEKSFSTTEQRTILLNALTFYNYLLRFVILISFLVITFGIPYAQFLLYIYGGTNLIDGPGPALLRFYCIYLLFLAVNGITEAFAQATRSIKELENYKNLISIFTVIYIVIFYILIKVIGIYGIVLSNCINMLLRITTNIYYIYRYFNGTQLLKPFQFSISYLLTLILTSFICVYSENWFQNSLLHFCFGVILGIGMLILTWSKEREMFHYIGCIIRLNRQKKIS